MEMENHSLFLVNSNLRTQTPVSSKLRPRSSLKVNSLLLKLKLLPKQLPPRRRKARLLMSQLSLRKVSPHPTSTILWSTLVALATRPSRLFVRATMT